MNNKKTEGEIQFEHFCVSNQIKFERIPEGTKREPDYKIRIDNMDIFIEIKDFALTEEDQNDIEQFENNGFCVGKTHKVGNKIINKINGAKGQLKKGEVNLIVLYDNRQELISGIYDYEIKIAMYGKETYILDVANKFGSPKLIGKKFGKGSTIRLNSNTRISAIAVLEDNLLHIYHNKFAANPLNVQSLSKIKTIKQYDIEIDKNKRFSDWIQINCIFRSKPTSHSGASRPLIPEQSDQ